MKLYQSEETNISIRIILQNVGFKKLRRFIAPLDFRRKFEPQIWRGSQCINPTYTRNRDINQDCLDRLPTVRTDDEIEERWMNCELCFEIKSWSIKPVPEFWQKNALRSKLMTNQQFSLVILCDVTWHHIKTWNVLRSYSGRLSRQVWYSTLLIIFLN